MIIGHMFEPLSHHKLRGTDRPVDGRKKMNLGSATGHSHIHTKKEN